MPDIAIIYTDRNDDAMPWEVGWRDSMPKALKFAKDLAESNPNYEVYVATEQYKFSTKTEVIMEKV
jgi:hypothetical protein